MTAADRLAIVTARADALTHAADSLHEAVIAARYAGNSLRACAKAAGLSHGTIANMETK